MLKKRISSALISVYSKEGLEPLVRLLHDLGIVIYSTGGTYSFIESLDIPVVAVEEITSYPSILGGRVKTLHPKVFGGILAIRNDDHLNQLAHYEIPLIDLVVVDLYPFEDTIRSTEDLSAIIEKIDIGGISLIRAAAKNYKEVVVIPSKNEYSNLAEILKSNGLSDESERKALAIKAFETSSHYDRAIYNYFSEDKDLKPLRYGENPHQKAWYEGNLNEIFDFHNGKELSYNNLLDIDSALLLMEDFQSEDCCFAILKHNNTCGLAIRSTVIDAWKAALAGDPLSAFGGIIITNKEIDLPTAQEIDELFYEVLIAPGFDSSALQLLSSKKKRILLKLKKFPSLDLQKRSCINGNLIQDFNRQKSVISDMRLVTQKTINTEQSKDLLFAINCIKHLKSNAIVLVKNQQLIGMGCGQTSRIDACTQAIDKAKRMGFSTNDAVMASEAFFPFPDCVELAGKAHITAIAQPGGSIHDQKSIDKANELNIAMVLTGIRHFKH
ncbi:MAG: bifunctional phosphoribosylaminoimidazolecarboxamide formyltransferase/IMP cyclohydrolase [Saprospiraceae bacterium]|nr:bifunctional phosphoribosylaminoimidazolecarboxamide formyltransferase/IMP cyclohydrolase [Saprospiraceae bacterium]